MEAHSPRRQKDEPRPERLRLELHLSAETEPEGEIALGTLAEVARTTQDLIRKLARSATHRSGPGRYPDELLIATELRLVGVHPGGSTVLEIAGPTLQSELDLEGIPADLQTRVVDALVDGAEALSKQSALPELYTEEARETLIGWTRALARYDHVRLDAHYGKERTVNLSGPEAREVATRVLERWSGSRVPRKVEGRLYLINLHTNTFGIEDDSGQSIRCVLETLEPESAAKLIGRRVIVDGEAELDDTGHIRQLRGREVGLAPDTSEFFAETALDDLVRGVQPLSSISELAIDDLTSVEYEGLLAALSDST